MTIEEFEEYAKGKINLRKLVDATGLYGYTNASWSKMIQPKIETLKKLNDFFGHAQFEIQIVDKLEEK